MLIFTKGQFTVFMLGMFLGSGRKLEYIFIAVPFTGSRGLYNLQTVTLIKAQQDMFIQYMHVCVHDCVCLFVCLRGQLFQNL